jgi:signal transduction histidine kinase
MDHGLHFNIEGTETALPLVWGNGDRIEQILVILLDNAMKFTPEGGRITIRTHAQYNGAAIMVEDTGSGIEPEDLEHVFDRFYKEDKAHQEPGTGLGLSIAREISKQLGYELSAQSIRDEGSSFKLLIPYASDITKTRPFMKDVYDSETADEN